MQTITVHPQGVGSTAGQLERLLTSPALTEPGYRLDLQACAPAATAEPTPAAPPAFTTLIVERDPDGFWRLPPATHAVFVQVFDWPELGPGDRFSTNALRALICRGWLKRAGYRFQAADGQPLWRQPRRKSDG